MMIRKKTMALVAGIIAVGMIGGALAYQTARQTSQGTVEQRFATFIDGGFRGLGPDERVQQLEALLADNPSTTTRSRIYDELGLICLSHSPSKAERYLGLALESAGQRPIADRLEIYSNLASAKTRMARWPGKASEQTTSAEWRQDRGEIVKVLWQGLRAAKDTDLPTTMPPQLRLPDRLNFLDHRLPSNEAEKRTRENERAERARFATMIEARRDVIRAVEMRDTLEHQLRALYLNAPLALDELAAQGSSIVEDQAYVDAIVNRTKQESMKEFQRRVDSETYHTPPVYPPTATPRPYRTPKPIDDADIAQYEKSQSAPATGR